MILKLITKIKENLDLLKVKLKLIDTFKLGAIVNGIDDLVPTTPNNTPVEGGMPESNPLDTNELINKLDEFKESYKYSTLDDSDNETPSESSSNETSSNYSNNNSSSESLNETSSNSSDSHSSPNSSFNDTSSESSFDSSIDGSVQESLNDFTASGPLDQFNVTELVGLKFEILGKFYLAITNISLYLGLVLAVIIAIFYFGDNDSKLVPNKWSIVLETFFASLKGMVKDQIGLAYEVFLPLIFAIFFFFLTGNLISNIPYSFATNASGVVSIGYSLTFFLGVTIISLFRHGDKFFRNFIPEGTPLALVPLLVSIEFTSYTARGFSLGVRMFSNLFSGHCLLAILSVFGNQLIGIN
jgi:F-type H+-transporting ATPase subunit a